MIKLANKEQTQIYMEEYYKNYPEQLIIATQIKQQNREIIKLKKELEFTQMQQARELRKIKNSANNHHCGKNGLGLDLLSGHLIYKF